MQNDRQTSSKSKREQIARKTIDRLKRFTEQLESGRPISEVYSCRQIVIQLPDPYTPEMVREVRALLNVSQALFARFLNVKVSTVQKWEIGASNPSGAACRLMDEIRRNTDYWRKRLRKLATVKKVPVAS